MTGTRTCPSCSSERVHHSRLRSRIEEIRFQITGKVPMRCHECGWRGWVADPGGADDAPAQRRSVGRPITPSELDTLEPPPGARVTPTE